jgi:hypothetical protein
MIQPAWRFKLYPLRGCNLSLLRHDLRCCPDYRFQGYWISTSRSVSIIWHCGMAFRSRRCLLIQPPCSLQKQVIIQTGSTHCKGLGGGRCPERVGLSADGGLNWCVVTSARCQERFLYMTDWELDLHVRFNVNRQNPAWVTRDLSCGLSPPRPWINTSSTGMNMILQKVH